jgi:glycosyltransferase involved in cell wall biosynthesis
MTAGKRVLRAVIVDLLCNTPYYCGPLAAALAAADVHVDLASPRFYPEPDYLDAYPRAPWIVDLAVHAARPRPLRLAARSVEAAINAAGLLARIVARRYDVVHVQWNPLEERTTLPMRILRARCDAAGALLVQTAHNAVPHDRPVVDRATIRANLELAHLVIAQTAGVASELRQELGVSTRIEVIPHPALFVDRDLPPRAAARARLGLGDGPVVAFIGLLRPYKGIDLLADAWPAVIDQLPDARLIVAGKRGDPQIEADLDRLRGLVGVTVDEGYLSVAAMLEVYAAADLVAVPYRRISQSGVLMTAAGLGRPVVVTPLAGLREQVATLDSAVIASAVDGPSLAAAIVTGLRGATALGEAALRDRATLMSGPAGWPAVARATRVAWEASRARWFVGRGWA